MANIPARALKALKLIQDHGSITKYEISKILDVRCDSGVIGPINKLIELGLVVFDVKNFSGRAQPLKVNPSKQEEVNLIIQREIDFWTTSSVRGLKC